MPNSSTPSVLVVSEPAQAEELSSALSELGRPIEVVVSAGGEQAVELFLAHRPDVVIMAASLQSNDAKSVMATLRGKAVRAAVGFVVVGEEHGPIRTAIDAIEFAPDRFVPRPLVPHVVRVAVREVLEDVESRKTAADSAHDPLSLPPLFEIRPRRDHQPMTEIPAWGEEFAQAGARPRKSTLIIRAPDPDPPTTPTEPTGPRMRSSTNPPPIPAIRSRGISGSPVRGGVSTQPTAPVEDEWSAPTPLSEVVERIDTQALAEGLPSVDALDGLDVDARLTTTGPMYDIGEFDDPDLIVPTPVPPRVAQDEPEAGQDFARQLRAKMSLMAKRLFHSEGAAERIDNPGSAGERPSSPVPRQGLPRVVGDFQGSSGISKGHSTPLEGARRWLDNAGRIDGEPRHIEHEEHDLAALQPDGPLDGVGVTAIARVNLERRERTLSPSALRSWDFPVRERDFSDNGELVRGVSDAAIVLARVFVRRTTGRVSFRQDDIEKTVYIDAGRPVFASSNAPGDRMGELLVREGKITAAQYDRCQADVTRSGRRIGEILVDFGYLKRRELLPAVRRHVEDIVFSVFGWTRGHYKITPDAAASGERIRMSRHPASLVLEGIRRKLDRATLERLVGQPSTVIDISSRDRLGSMVNASDLVEEERAALAAFDGRADLVTVARTAGVDIADVLPLAWGLVVLELATARRVETEDSSAGLMGETDLAIDRDRICARWNLVAEADYFALLGVRRDATGFEIRRAYQSARRDFSAENFSVDLQRELSRELADIATVLDEAFRVMRDDGLRVMYLSHLPD